MTRAGARHAGGRRRVSRGPPLFFGGSVREHLVRLKQSGLLASLKTRGWGMNEFLSVRCFMGRHGVGLRLTGELDLATVTRAEIALLVLGGNVELDLSGVTFLDACTIAMLLQAHQRHVARGTHLTITGLHGLP